MAVYGINCLTVVVNNRSNLQRSFHRSTRRTASTGKVCVPSIHLTKAACAMDKDEMQRRHPNLCLKLYVSNTEVS